MNIEEAITSYSNIKPNKDLISRIDVNYFFEFAETLLTAYEKEKRLAEANLKDSEEFKDNMCNHRCIKNAEVLELKEYYKENYTPNYKIKAKIEELIKEGNYRTADNPNGRVHFQKEITDYQIEVLQSLLEKE